jgi:RsiW-degrading membrane proteinase PrsW (M82 family)
LPTVGVALIEEACKLLPPLAVLLTGRYRRTINGLVIGLASGAGFAVMETLGYSATALLRSHDNVGEVNNLLFQRGLFSPTTHMAWTALAAAAFWHAAGKRWSPRTIGLLTATLTLVVGLHAAWDQASSLTAYATLAAISGAVLGYVINRLAAADRHWNCRDRRGWMHPRGSNAP